MVYEEIFSDLLSPDLLTIVLLKFVLKHALSRHEKIHMRERNQE